MSCLFYAIGRLTGHDGHDVRRMICDELETNPQLYQDGTRAAEAVTWLEHQPLAAYVETMRLSSTWGGALEIKVWSDLTSTPVNVHDLTCHPRRVITFLPRQQQHEPIALSWNGGHYEAIR
jgi:hypothetical protein